MTPIEAGRAQSRAVERILEIRADPLGVLASTAAVVEAARWVSIDRTRVHEVAVGLAGRPVSIPKWNYDYHFFDGGPATVNYLFLLDTLNFSFWGEPRWGIEYRGHKLDGYWALAASLKRAAEENARVLEANYLAEITPADMEHVLGGGGIIPMFAERWRNVRELGRVLCEQFGGQAVELVRAADRDAARFARLVSERISSFDDTTVYDGRSVRFLKRAQILAADIWGAFKGEEPGDFKNLADLTAFADYKLPQLLRAWGVLKYKRGLARRVDARVELAKDSSEEIEIRAATLWAVEALREELASKGIILTGVQMDWFLWETSHGAVSGMRPYHRVRTIFY